MISDEFIELIQLKTLLEIIIRWKNTIEPNLGVVGIQKHSFNDKNQTFLLQITHFPYQPKQAVAA